MSTESSPVPEAPDRATSARRSRLDVLGWSVVTVAIVLLFAKLGGVSSPGSGWPSWLPWTWRPGPLFRDTIATGGDTGAHVWTPWFVRRNLLHPWRPTGWSKDWFAGFPVLHFYFPLPTWAIVALGFVVPENVAFKLVTVAGVLALPFASMLLAHSLQLPRHHRYLFALASIVFLVDSHHQNFGGNILSTLAGEFSFSIAMTAAVLFLALVVRMYRTGRGRPLAALALAVTCLSHVVPAMFAVVAAASACAVHVPLQGGAGSVRRLRDTVLVGATGGLLAAFWMVPFASRLAYSNDMGYETATNYVGSLVPALARPAPGGSVLISCCVVLAFIGGIHQSVRFGRAVRGRAEPDAEALAGALLSAIATAAALAFRFRPARQVLNERFLPFWFFGCSLLAVFGLGSLGALVQTVRAVLRRPAARWSPMTHLAIGAVLSCWTVGTGLRVLPGIVPIPTWQHGRLGIQRSDSTDDVIPVAEWAKENYDGYEAVDEWPELSHIFDVMGSVGRTNGCGRAMWDYEDQIGRYGTEVAFMLLPMRTDSCITSMEGMYFESTATGPYHWINASLLSGTGSDSQLLLSYPGLDVARGVARLQQWGVRYYLVFSPSVQAQARRQADLRLVAVAPYDRPCDQPEVVARRCPSTLEVYEVRHAELVEGLALEPAVVTGIDASQRGGWLDVAMAQYLSPASFPVPLAADGPNTWKRVVAAFGRGAAIDYGSAVSVGTAPARSLPAVRVSDIVEGQGRISFTVDRLGVPVVVKESYFPTWRATGADGPWRLAPNMMVVIPTSHEVTLHVGSEGADRLGLALTALGACCLVGLMISGRRRRRHSG